MNKKIDKNTILDMLAKPAQYEYFFKRLDKPGWFDFLADLKVFSDIPEPRLIDDGKLIEFPIWWPGKYLNKVANKIPNKVLLVIENVKTNNCSALDDCSQAILNMPDEFVKDNYSKLIVLYDKWLNNKYIGRIQYDAEDLFDKLMKIECCNGAMELLSILSRIKTDKKDAKFRFEVYYYKEIIKKYFAKLVDYDAIKLLDIIEKRLKEAIDIERSSKESGDDSIGWRPSIEDSSQNWGFDDPKDIFVDILRDTLHKLVESNPTEAKRITQRYLEEKYLILKRLAINAIRISSFSDLAQSLIIDRNNLDDLHIHHEFFKLVEDKYSTLTSAQKKSFITSILDVSEKDITREEDEEIAKKYKRSWQARRLFMIKKYLETDKDISEYKYLLDDYRDIFNKLDHPDYPSYHTSWTGPTSSLSKDQILGMSVEQFIEWIKNNLQPPFDMMGPSPEGVSRIFQEVVKENPALYANVADKFIDKKIFPAYLCGLTRGLEEAAKSKKTFNILPIMKVIEDPLKYCKEPVIDSRFDRFDIGEYSWFRGAIANLIESLVMNDDFELSEEIMNRTQTVLEDIVLKDADPTEASEKEYGPLANNMDYVTYCINSNRGKAMCALMQHALRRARMRPLEEKKKEEGKGPFPPGERMGRYKEFLTKRLNDEPSASVQSSYGRFLTYLCYLDQGWINEMLQTGKLFPKDNKRQAFWEGHWQGYVGFHGVYNQLYDWLKDDYGKAIQELLTPLSKKDKSERYGHRLAEHLMIAFWRKLENINSGGKIYKFFEIAPIDVRGHAIWFVGTAINDNPPKLESEEWKRLRSLWEFRVKNCKDEELGNFVKWLKNCPEKIDNIKDLIQPIISYVYKHFNERDFLEYLLSKITESPLTVLELLNQLLQDKKAVSQLFFWGEVIKAILTKSQEYKEDGRIVRIMNTVVNKLGEVGHYEFREFLIKE